MINPPPAWVKPYIGLPFRDRGRDRSGVDCWGLVRLVLQEKFSVAVPSFDADYQSTLDAERISRKIIEERERGWQRVEYAARAAGDVICIRMRGQEMHVGLVLNANRMLHIEQKISSCHEDYTGQRWKNRITGFYRHADLCAPQ